MSILSWHIPRDALEDRRNRVMLKISAMPVFFTFRCEEVTELVGKLNSISKFRKWST